MTILSRTLQLCRWNAHIVQTRVQNASLSFFLYLQMIKLQLLPFSLLICVRSGGFTPPAKKKVRRLPEHGTMDNKQRRNGFCSSSNNNNWAERYSKRPTCNAQFKLSHALVTMSTGFMSGRTAQTVIIISAILPPPRKDKNHASVPSLPSGRTGGAFKRRHYEISGFLPLASLMSRDNEQSS